MTIVVKYIIAKWVADKTKNLFIKFFVISEREVAVWTHFHKGGVGDKHLKPIAECEDDKCAILKLK